MNKAVQSLAIAGLALLVIAGIVAGVAMMARHHSRTATAQAAVERWAATLDAQTDDRGIYIRHESNVLPELDPWGNPLQVTYSQGGMMETLEVRSFGPDGSPYTSDDIFAVRHSANLKGVGTGIRDGIEATAAGAARGVVSGLADGVRDLRRRPNDEEAEEQGDLESAGEGPMEPEKADPGEG